MNIIGKLLLAIGIIVGISLAFAVGVIGYVFSTMSSHGISPGTSYSDDFEYKYERDFSQLIDATGKSSLHLKNPLGKIHITGWDNPQVEVTGTLNSSEEDLFDRINVQYNYDNDRIQIEVPERNGTNFNEWSVDFVINVPRDLALDIDLGVGKLRIEQISTTGQVNIDAGVGELELVDITADELNVENGVGEVFVDRVVADHAVFDIGIGELEYHMSRTSDVSVNMHVGVGDLDIEGYSFPNVYVQERGFMSRSAEFELGEGDARLEIELGMGDITLRIQDE